MKLPRKPIQFVRRRSDPDTPDSVNELRSILSALQQYATREPLQVEDAIKWIEAVGDRDTEDRVLQLAERLMLLLLVIVPPAFALLLMDGHLNFVLPEPLRIVLQVVGYLGLTTATSGGILIGVRALKKRKDPSLGR
jgi:hypothetical protein